MDDITLRQDILEKEAAEGVARRVKGVRGIAQEIEVRIFGAKKTRGRVQQS